MSDKNHHHQHVLWAAEGMTDIVEVVLLMSATEHLCNRIVPALPCGPGVNKTWQCWNSHLPATQRIHYQCMADRAAQLDTSSFDAFTFMVRQRMLCNSLQCSSDRSLFQHCILQGIILSILTLLCKVTICMVDRSCWFFRLMYLHTWSTNK